MPDREDAGRLIN